MSRLLGLVAFEVKKLLARRTPLVAFLAVLALALAAPLAGHVVDSASALMKGKAQAGSDAFANGWTTLAGSVTTARPFLVLVVLVLAASAVSEEAAQGTLKALFVRPVRRLEVLAAKALAIWGFGVLLLVGVVLVGALGGELSQGLYDVVDPVYVERTKHTFGSMLRWVALATLATVPPLLAVTSLGLLVSCLLDHPGHATGAAIVSLFALSAAAGLSDDAQRLLFVTHAARPFEVVNDVANQFSGVAGDLSLAKIAASALVSLGWSAALLAAAGLLLQRRDVAGHA